MNFEPSDKVKLLSEQIERFMDEYVYPNEAEAIQQFEDCTEADPPLVRELRPWTVFAALLGLLFGVLAYWSESLLGPAIAHLLINWLNLHRLGSLELPE